MTSRGALRDLTAAALYGQTDAQNRVYTPADWPTVMGEYPVILVRATKEDKVSLGRSGAPMFTATATVRVIGKVEALAQTADYGALVAEDAAERLERQILAAVINNPAIMGELQQYPQIRSQTDVDASGETHLAELTLDIDMEYVTGPDDLYPIPALPLAGVDVTLDALNVFDAHGDYPENPFPGSASPAPRTSGPDGRAEGDLTLSVPQN